MITSITVDKKAKVNTLGETVFIQQGEAVLQLTFDSLETIEDIENNLSHLACAKRAETTIKEGVENGKA